LTTGGPVGLAFGHGQEVSTAQKEAEGGTGRDDPDDSSTDDQDRDQARGADARELFRSDSTPVAFPPSRLLRTRLKMDEAENITPDDETEATEEPSSESFAELARLARDKAEQMEMPEDIGARIYDAFSKKTAALGMTDEGKKAKALAEANQEISKAFNTAGLLVLSQILPKIGPQMFKSVLGSVTKKHVESALEARDNQRRLNSNSYRHAYSLVADDPLYGASFRRITPETFQLIMESYRKATGRDLLHERYQNAEGEPLSAVANAERQYRAAMRFGLRNGLIPPEVPKRQGPARTKAGPGMSETLEKEMLAMRGAYDLPMTPAPSNGHDKS
jgi:hypothetical protein